MNLKYQIYSLIGIVLLGAVCRFYIDRSLALGKENKQLHQSLSEQLVINTKQQARIKQLAEQDAQRLQALTHAKTEIDRLHTASLAHPERVYIKAQCPAIETVATPGMADATRARPTDTAVRNYWLLRERITTTEQMIAGLQDYIQTQCQ
ncbi:lysis system i-spanin subunit Rz [Xenorhabdus sp. KK7.4]|uniref:lysis system i-spanin subunit Rz n=1 Tax=Xenorhabdus sp. KK7.4 TaxID=1851572 RepID=UPI000C03EDF3|nr:lysis system i-spanin subunit Rz [Xenorhabdus sp. KK7.4]PHM51734.1 lysis protein [Xenorhabdus sp. KK7.4]